MMKNTSNLVAMLYKNDGSVTMTYVDGNGKPVTGEEAKNYWHR